MIFIKNVKICYACNSGIYKKVKNNSLKNI